MKARRSDAHKLLDRVRLGDRSVPKERITAALIETGDLAEDGSEALPVRRQVRQAGTWERRESAGFLARATWLDALTG